MKMKTILSNHSCMRPDCRIVWAFIFALVMSLGQVAHAATTFVTLNNGHVQVFPDSCVQSINSTGGYLTITALDGQQYSYALHNVKDVDTVLTKEMPVLTSFTIDNKLNYQVITDAVGTITADSVNVEVLGIGKWLTPTFTVSDSTALVHVGDVEQISSVNRFSFANDRIYTVGYEGDDILQPIGDGTYAMQPYGSRYTVHVNFLTDGNTAVPRIDINTVGGENITSLDYYLDAEIIIDGQGIFPSMTDSVQIKGRGHSSWTGDPDKKNPYRLKFKDKVKPLGLKKGKNWVLLANNMYGSLLLSAIGMKAASIIGTPAANHIIPVDLYVNGVYKGNYNFTEKIGFSNNSIDLADESAATLLEIDVNYDEDPDQKFISYPTQMLVNVHEPTFSDTASTVLTLRNVKNRFSQFTQAVLNNNNVSAHVDVDYAARYLMFNEYICNYEILHPKSCWCYHENILDESSKFIFGPAWDFDWAYGYDTNREYFTCDPAIDYINQKDFGQRDFFAKFRNNKEVKEQFYEHCKDFVENGIDELCDYVNEYYEYALPSLLMNRWYIHDYTDYAEQTGLATTWLRERANALLAAIEHELTVIPGDVDGSGKVDIDDLTILIDYLLSGGSIAIDSLAADVDESGAVNIDDVTLLIDRLLSRD